MKRDKDDKGGKFKELIKVLKNHEIESDEEESENEHQEMKESSSENESKRIKRKGGEPAQVTSASKKLMASSCIFLFVPHLSSSSFNISYSFSILTGVLYQVFKRILIPYNSFRVTCDLFLRLISEQRIIGDDQHAFRVRMK